MSENMIFAAFFFPALAVCIVFAMKYVSAVLQARARAVQDEAYRALAQKMAETQSDMSAAIAAHGEHLTSIASRLGSVEKMLKDVE